MASAGPKETRIELDRLGQVPMMDLARNRILPNGNGRVPRCCPWPWLVGSSPLPLPSSLPRIGMVSINALV